MCFLFLHYNKRYVVLISFKRNQNRYIFKTCFCIVTMHICHHHVLHISDELIRYCKTVAAEAPDLPFYYYHLPIMTQVNRKYINYL